MRDSTQIVQDDRKSSELEVLKTRLASELYRMDISIDTLRTKVNQIKLPRNPSVSCDQSPMIKVSQSFCDEYHSLLNTFEAYNNKLNELVEDLNDIV